MLNKKIAKNQLGGKSLEVLLERSNNVKTKKKAVLAKKP